MNYANDFIARTCTFVYAHYLPGLPITAAVKSQFVKTKECSRGSTFLADTVETYCGYVGHMELEYINMNKY